MISQATPSLKVPLGREAHCLARQFATQQATPQKGKQVYLNTLAVYAVHSYLKWLQIETDLSQGYSWLPGLRALFNVADLVLPGIGRLECRPVLPEKTACELPLEVREDRIGYVAVQFGYRFDEVQLLGFVRAVDISDATEQILIADLQPLDTLLECIPSNVVAPEPVFTASKVQVKLSRWLQNFFEAGWQTLEALHTTEAVNLAFTRSAEQFRKIDALHPSASMSAGKLIDMGMQLAGQRVVLIVAIAKRSPQSGIAPSSDQEVNIRMRVCPTGSQTYLPPGLQLTAFDASGATSPDLEAQARSDDNWIQLEFSGEPGEHFSVKVTLGDVSITEDFVI